MILLFLPARSAGYNSLHVRFTDPENSPNQLVGRQWCGRHLHSAASGVLGLGRLTSHGNPRKIASVVTISRYISIPSCADDPPIPMDGARTRKDRSRFWRPRSGGIQLHCVYQFRHHRRKSSGRTGLEPVPQTDMASAGIGSSRSTARRPPPCTNRPQSLVDLRPVRFCHTVAATPFLR